MTPLDPAELSAFLDGELPPARARQIEALLAEDSALRAEFEALRQADADWRQAGAAAMFVSPVRPPSADRGPAISPWSGTVAAALLLARIGGKFIDPLAPSLLLNLAALVLVGWAVAALSRSETGPAR
jgi:anti-sigma factor RsiW